jgi:hypothetical protein
MFLRIYIYTGFKPDESAGTGVSTPGGREPRDRRSRRPATDRFCTGLSLGGV